jgi:hypothetical protein
MAFIFAAMLGEGQANHQGVRVFLSLAEPPNYPSTIVLAIALSGGN